MILWKTIWLSDPPAQCMNPFQYWDLIRISTKRGSIHSTNEFLLWFYVMCLNMWQSLSRRIFPHSVRPAIIDTTLFFSTSDLFSSPAPRAGNIQCIYSFQQNALVCFEIYLKRLYWCYRDLYLFWWLRSFSGGGTLDSTPPISAISCVWGNQSFIFTFTFYRVSQK